MVGFKRMWTLVSWVEVECDPPVIPDLYLHLLTLENMSLLQKCTILPGWTSWQLCTLRTWNACMSLSDTRGYLVVLDIDAKAVTTCWQTVSWAWERGRLTIKLGSNSILRHHCMMATTQTLTCQQILSFSYNWKKWRCVIHLYIYVIGWLSLGETYVLNPSPICVISTLLFSSLLLLCSHISDSQYRVAKQKGFYPPKYPSTSSF